MEIDLLHQITNNQAAIRGLSEALMPLLVSNLEHLAAANTSQRETDEGRQQAVDYTPSIHNTGAGSPSSARAADTRDGRSGPQESRSPELFTSVPTQQSDGAHPQFLSTGNWIQSNVDCSNAAHLQSSNAGHLSNAAHTQLSNAAHSHGQPSSAAQAYDQLSNAAHPSNPAHAPHRGNPVQPGEAQGQSSSRSCYSQPGTSNIGTGYT